MQNNLGFLLSLLENEEGQCVRDCSGIGSADIAESPTSGGSSEPTEGTPVEQYAIEVIAKAKTFDAMKESLRQSIEEFCAYMQNKNKYTCKVSAQFVLDLLEGGYAVNVVRVKRIYRDRKAENP